MISLAHRTVYVHIPKCGGQSIETAFLADLGLEFGRHRRLMLCHERPQGWPGESRRLAHLFASEYIAHYLAREVYESFFTFATIRDPYDRAESHFLYGGFGDPAVKPVEVRRYPGRKTMRRLGRRLGLVRRRPPAPRASFAEFVAALPRLATERPFYYPQARYVFDETDTLLVDRLVPLRKLSRLWPEIAARAGVSAPLPHHNRTPRDEALVWTDEMHRAVETAYARDFDLLGFKKRGRVAA